MSTLHTWAVAWSIPLPAVQDLQRRLGTLDAVTAVTSTATSEAGLSNRLRLEASAKGMHLFRNNVGVLKDDRGVPVRFGLANDSSAMNKVVKSADLIGWDADGRFLSIEVKKPGWRFTGTPRELAQQRWAELVVAGGGRAAIVSTEGQL